jgi:hypothetical protein
MKWARVVHALFHLVAFPVGFFFSRSFISRKNNVEKILDPFDAPKVPESQKCAKTRKYASQYYNQMKGDRLENPPESMKTCPSPYKLSDN